MESPSTNPLTPAPAASNTPEASGCGLFVVATLMGGLAALAFVDRQLFSPRGAGAVIGWAMLVAGPWVLGVLAGLFQQRRPVWTGLWLSVVCMLAFAPLAGEGAICLIFIAPWFLFITPLLAYVTVTIKYWKHDRSRPLAVIFLLLMPSGALWWEQRHPAPAAPVNLSDSVVLAAPVEKVWAALEGVDLTLPGQAPWLIRALLPQPQSLVGGGAHVGAERRVVFHNGVIVARIVRSEPLRSFEMDLTVTESGTEFFDHWATLGRSTISLEPLPDGRTRLTHSTWYTPRVTVRWYAEPFERRMGHLLQDYLLRAFAEELFPEPSPSRPVAVR